MIFLILLLLVVLGLYASFVLWPNRSLWFLLERTNRQHYRVHLDDVTHRLDSPLAILVEKPNLKMPSLLKRLSNLPVYWITDTRIKSTLQRKLMQRAGIYVFANLDLLPKDQPGIVILSSNDEVSIKQLALPIWLGFLCGEVAASHTRMRWIPRDLQLTLHRYLDKDGPLTLALQRVLVYAWDRYVDKLPSIVESWLD